MIAENTFADYCGDKRRKAPNIILYNVEQLTYSLNVVRGNLPDTLFHNPKSPLQSKQ